MSPQSPVDVDDVRGRLRRTSKRSRSRACGARGLSQLVGVGESTQPRRLVTLIPGDGIGREVTKAVVDTFAAMQAPIDWESFNLLSPDENRDQTDRLEAGLLSSIRRNGFAIKGPFFTPMQDGFVSPDLSLARVLGLFAHVVPVKSIPAIKTRHDNVDLVVIRENTEGEYSGLEHLVNNGVVQSLKVITREASRRVAEYAFEYAVRNGRKKVTAVHKANIMKMADGLFLQCTREVAGLYKDQVEYDEVIIDNCCMQLVSRPEQFDVMVTGNLYGNIVSESAAGLAGGVALIPGVNVGKEYRVYEQGCRHIGLDIAGANAANPTALLESAAMMLADMGLVGYAGCLKNAIRRTYENHVSQTLTVDIPNGAGTTESFTQAVIDNMDMSDLDTDHTLPLS